MYVNNKISWIRALRAEIIDFVDDGIFLYLAVVKTSKSLVVIWKTLCKIAATYAFSVAKRFQIFKIYNLSRQSSDLVQNWCASLVACI